MSSPKFHLGDRVSVDTRLIGVITKVNVENNTYHVLWNGDSEPYIYQFYILEQAGERIKASSKHIKRVTNVQTGR